MFLHDNCEKCKRYMKNGEFTCKIEERMTLFDESTDEWPKEINIDKMKCSKFTDENKKIIRKRRQLKGQISLLG